VRAIISLVTIPLLTVVLLGRAAVAPKEARAEVRVVPAAARAAQAEGPRRVRAKAAYLFDETAGRTLWARHPTTKLPIGSMTKVMTALIVIQRGHLDRKIRIKRRYLDYAFAHHGSTAGLRVGDRITARELLYAMLLPSGCDAAAALADAYGPGERGFVRVMNRRAVRLGMRRTHYASFDGTTSGYSTARDMVTLGRYAMRDPTFRETVRQSKHILPAGGGHHRYVWRSTNLLLRYDPGVVGIKTGYTREAGYCSLFAAQSGGRALIGVVMHSSRTNPNARVTDAIKVLNWGFDH
jgi:D-alanyl-D-alanine carboxypeptidase (penicillin-binding protein 5/6)